MNTRVGPEESSNEGKNFNSIMATFLLSIYYISSILLLMKILKDSKTGITIRKFLLFL